MSTKSTEWKSVYLSKVVPDLAGAHRAHIEHDGDSFIAATFMLKGGGTIRIRKADYGVKIEEPVTPVDTKWQVKTHDGLTLMLDDDSKAREIASKYDDAEVIEVKIPKQTEVLSF